MKSEPLLTFIIPIKHYKNVDDWELFLKTLSQTIGSIMQQTNNLWKCVIVANKGSKLPKLNNHFEIKLVDYPENKYFDISQNNLDLCYEAVREDKGKKVLAGLLHTHPTPYYMVVDDDDFINSELTNFVANNLGENGWYFDKGYIWYENSSFLVSRKEFHELCGTSHIIKTDLLEIDLHKSDLEYIKKYLGSHKSIKNFLNEKGNPLKELPFYGAIYRVGHVNAHSKNYFSKLKYLQFILQNLLKIRFISMKLKQDFFG